MACTIKVRLCRPEGNFLYALCRKVKPVSVGQSELGRHHGDTLRGAWNVERTLPLIGEEMLSDRAFTLFDTINFLRTRAFLARISPKSFELPALTTGRAVPGLRERALACGK